MLPDIEGFMRREGIDGVINAAAYTAVDDAEHEQAAAFELNHSLVDSLAKACANGGQYLFHFSTDYVFDGRSTAPYRETDSCHPSSVYGKSKLAGEQAVVERCDHATVLRVSWVFSAIRKNFVRTMLANVSRSELSIVDDQIGTPCFADDIAEASWDLYSRALGIDADLSVYGIFHFSSAPAVSWYEFAKAIFALAREFGVRDVPIVHPIPTSDYPTAAMRPANSVMLDEKLRALNLKTTPGWAAGLREVVRKVLG